MRKEVEMWQMKLLSSACSVWCQYRADAHKSHGGGLPWESECSLWCQADACSPTGLWLECKLNRPEFYGCLKTLDMGSEVVMMPS